MASSTMLRCIGTKYLSNYQVPFLCCYMQANTLRNEALPSTALQHSNNVLTPSQNKTAREKRTKNNRQNSGQKLDQSPICRRRPYPETLLFLVIFRRDAANQLLIKQQFKTGVEGEVTRDMWLSNWPSLIPAVPLPKTWNLKCSFTPLVRRHSYARRASFARGDFAGSDSHGKISVPEVLGLVKAQMVKNAVYCSLWSKRRLRRGNNWKECVCEKCKLR